MIGEESVQSSYSIVSDSLEIFVTYQVKVGDRTMFTAENLESQRQVKKTTSRVFTKCFRLGGE